MTRLLLICSLLLGALATPEQCRSDIAGMAMNTYPDGLKMIYFSGRGFDDLGMYNECNRLSSARYALVEAKYDGLRVVLGFCGPVTCSLDDYSVIGKELYEKLHLENYEKLSGFKAYFSKEYSEESMDGAAIFVLMLWILLLTTVAAGTAFEYMAMKNPQKRFGPVSRTCMAFSLINNFNKLVTLPEEFDTLQMFNGIRVFSMIIVVLGHHYIYQTSAAIQNITEAKNVFTDFKHLFLIIYVVDIFFMMAGFLLAYLTTAQLKATKGRMNWVVFEAHRFIRLIPIYYFCFFTYNWLLRYIGSGPQWPLFKQITPAGCDDYWWANLFFVQNFFPVNEHGCMGWSWYIMNDLQFYVFSPIVLILYFKNKLWGWACCGTLIFINWLVVGIQASVNDWNPTYFYGMANHEQFLDNYIKPYARMAPYVLGMMIGFIYRSTVDAKAAASAKTTISLEMNPNEYSLIQEEKPKAQIDRNPITYLEARAFKWVHVPALRYIGYVIGFTLMCVINFSPYQLNKDGVDSWSTSHKAAFMVFDHFTFALGFAFFMVPMLFGYCKGLLKVLTLKFLAPLAKISFAVYVVHPLFIYYYALSRDQAVYYGDLDILYHAGGTLLFATIAGTILSLMVESPILALEKSLLRGGRGHK